MGQHNLHGTPLCLDNRTSRDTERAGIWGDSLGTISHIKLSLGAFRGNPPVSLVPRVSLLVDFPDMPPEASSRLLLPSLQATGTVSRKTTAQAWKRRCLGFPDQQRRDYMGAPFLGGPIQKWLQLSWFDFKTNQKEKKGTLNKKTDHTIRHERCTTQNHLLHWTKCAKFDHGWLTKCSQEVTRATQSREKWPLLDSKHPPRDLGFEARRAWRNEPGV